MGIDHLAAHLGVELHGFRRVLKAAGGGIIRRASS
jgi:hypothetical protein